MNPKVNNPSGKQNLKIIQKDFYELGNRIEHTKTEIYEINLLLFLFLFLTLSFSHSLSLSLNLSFSLTLLLCLTFSFYLSPLLSLSLSLSHSASPSRLLAFRFGFSCLYTLYQFQSTPLYSVFMFSQGIANVLESKYVHTLRRILVFQASRGDTRS